MPIFEYKCADCGHVTEFLEARGAKRQHACEKCRSAKTRKVLSTFAAHAGTSSSGDSGCPTGTCSLPR
jgi:putative FmdB family regulatory protein